MWSSPQRGRTAVDCLSMSETLSIIEYRHGAAKVADETLCLLMGAGLTFVIFFGVAHFEMARPAASAPEIEDLRVMSAFMEPPPPKVDERPDQVSLSEPLTGMEIGPSDSSVKISVVPPDLDKIIPPSDLPPQGDDPVQPALFRPEAQVRRGGRPAAHLPAERGRQGPRGGGQDDRPCDEPHPRERAFASGHACSWSSTRRERSAASGS